MYGQTGSGKTHTLLGPPRFYELPTDSWGICPKFFLSILQRAESDTTTFHATAVELYFDDCFDLFNKKAKIPIAG